MTPSQVPVRAEIKVPKTDLPPEAANWFNFGLANLDVQMLIGYVDPHQAGDFVQAMTTGQKNAPPLTPMIVRRIMMSMTGFAQLRSQVHEMERRMKEAGIPFFDESVAKPPNG
jgi:uncharacterized protein YneF (UPF0154 family)